MAVVYIAIGHECKKQINSLREKSIHDLPFTIGALVLIVVFAFIVYEQNVFHFSIDMKYVNYKECILSVLLPIAFGILILRSVGIIDSLSNILDLCNHFILLTTSS